MPRMMIVDDEYVIRQGLISMIERVAPEWEVCMEAGDGEEALRMIQESDQVDLVFSDIRMPKLDGLQLLKRLSERGNSLPVIILSGFGDFHYAQEALQYGTFDYLLKPIHERQLREVLDRFMTEKFVPTGEVIDQAVQSRIDQFEFELVNALEALDKPRIRRVLADCEKRFRDLPHVVVLNHLIRIINAFFTRKGIYGLEYVPKAVTGQLATQLDTIGRKTCDLADRVGSHAEPPGSDRLIEKAQAYMKRHLNEALTLTRVAEHIHLNPTYFSEYFRAKTGETFSRCYARLRMEEAKRRLRQTPDKINEIAEQCGYHDANYFSKMFKLMVGMTPKEYRYNSQTELSEELSGPLIS